MEINNKSNFARSYVLKLIDQLYDDENDVFNLEDNDEYGSDIKVTVNDETEYLVFIYDDFIGNMKEILSQRASDIMRVMEREETGSSDYFDTDEYIGSKLDDRDALNELWDDIDGRGELRIEYPFVIIEL